MSYVIRVFEAAEIIGFEAAGIDLLTDLLGALFPVKSSGRVRAAFICRICRMSRSIRVY